MQATAAREAAEQRLRSEVAETKRRSMDAVRAAEGARSQLVVRAP